MLRGRSRGARVWRGVSETTRGRGTRGEGVARAYRDRARGRGTRSGIEGRTRRRGGRGGVRARVGECGGKSAETKRLAIRRCGAVGRSPGHLQQPDVIRVATANVKKRPVRVAIRTQHHRATHDVSQGKVRSRRGGGQQASQGFQRGHARAVRLVQASKRRRREHRCVRAPRARSFSSRAHRNPPIDD